MVNVNIDELRSKLDMEGKYVEFDLIRTALTVLMVAEDVGTQLNEPNEDGECRGDCPKCDKKRSFSLNINRSRFNCFNKECDLKGGGVIDFASRLFDTTAKEASHLLACAHGIQPYTAESSGGGGLSKFLESEDQRREVEASEAASVPRSDYEQLEKDHNQLRKEFDTLRNIVYAFMIEQDDASVENYENPEYEHTVAH